MTEPISVDPNESIETINSIIESDGCIVIRDLLSKDQLTALRAELEPLFLDTEDCQGDFYGHKTKRLSGLIGKSETTRQMAIHATILAIMDEFLLRGCRAYQLNLTQAIRIGHEEPQQVLHRDDSMFPFAHPESEAMINCLWAVDHFTFDNGATHIVPGSHKWEDPQKLPKEHELTQGAMPAGSVLIYLGSLIHGGGANNTYRDRTGLVISYCQGWLRQAENQYLAVPQDQAAYFPITRYPEFPPTPLPGRLLSRFWYSQTSPLRYFHR